MIKIRIFTHKKFGFVVGSWYVEEMEFRAQRTELDRMLRFVESQAAKAHLSGRALHDLRLACEEALVNVIDHAYRNQPNETVQIECTPDEHQLKVTIKDSGKPFDPRLLPDPDTGASLEERHIGGLGVFMVRNLVDDMDYQRLSDLNVLTLLKRDR